LYVTAAAVLVTLGCGGKGTSDAEGAAAGSPMQVGDEESPEGNGGRSPLPNGGSGGSGAGRSPGSSTPGGSSGGVGGQCAALCLPTAQFNVNIVSHADEILNSPLEVCRNDECYQGTFESVPTNTPVTLKGETWDETRVTMFYQAAAELTLHLSWSLTPYSEEFVDGDHYTLRALTASGETLEVIDTDVTYERYEFCAGRCTRALLPLEGPSAEAQGGAGGT